MRKFRVYTRPGTNGNATILVPGDRIDVQGGDLCLYRVEGSIASGDFKREIVAYFKKDTWTHFVEEGS